MLFTCYDRSDLYSLVIVIRYCPEQTSFKFLQRQVHRKARVKKSISRARDPRLPDQPEPPTHGCGSIFANERVRLEAVVGELLELSIVE